MAKARKDIDEICDFIRKEIESNGMLPIDMRPLEVRKYSAEKILSTVPKKSIQEPIGKMKEMSLISCGSKERTFVEQAKFMEDFEDDRNVTTRTFESYWPTYQSMDYTQLQTYFTWRTRVRRGVIENIGLSYAFVYIYELINNIGVKNPDDGMQKLLNFWSTFRQHSRDIDKYMKNWCRDYYVVNTPEQPFDFYKSQFPIKYQQQHSSLIKEIEKMKNGLWSLDFIEKCSSHCITQTAFYKPENSEIIKKCLNFVLNRLSEFFSGKNIDLTRLFVKTTGEDSRFYPFKNAIYVEATKGNKRVELDCYNIYVFSDGNWYRNIISDYCFYRTKGYILKVSEIEMRKVTGAGQRLREPNVENLRDDFTIRYKSQIKLVEWNRSVYSLIKSGEVRKHITDAVRKFFSNITISEGKMQEAKPLEIDTSKLGKIREEHKEVAEKLSTEEDIVEIEIPVKQKNNENNKNTGWDGLISSLTQDEKDLLLLILNSNVKSFLDISSELLIETINEKSLDYLGDNIIDVSTENVCIYEDYVEYINKYMGE
jgi:hypothetical protein